MKTFNEFLTEANRRAQVASKRNPKPQKQPKDTRPKAFVTVGLPGSGKSTLVKSVRRKDPNTAQAELDQSRKALGKGPAYFGQDLIKHQGETINKAAEHGHTIMHTNTSLPKAHRDSAVKDLESKGYNAKAILLPTSQKAAMRRNRKRPAGAAPGEGQVPQFVMNRMANTLKNMSRSERRQLRKNYKEFKREYRPTKPNLKRP